MSSRRTNKTAKKVFNESSCVAPIHERKFNDIRKYSLVLRLYIILQKNKRIPPFLLDVVFGRSLSFYIQLFIWLILYYFFIQWEFGVVYFVLSGFYFIYITMGNESDEKKDRVSAYSVFNKNGEEVLGNFNTTGLERSFGLPNYGDQ